MNDDLMQYKNFLIKALENIGQEDLENSNSIYDAWKKVLFRVKSGNSYEGKNLYSHSKIKDFQKGVLFVECDHPGWIEIFQFHKNYILKGMQIEIKDIKINNIVFKLSAENEKNNKYSPEEIDKMIEKRLEEEAKDIEKYENSRPKGQGEIQTEKKEMNPELKKIFDDLYESMTNSFKNSVDQ